MHPNELLARREIELINAGDLEALNDLYTDDFVIHYPGKNRLAGSNSLQEFLARFEMIFKDGILRRELHDALDTDDHAVELLSVTASVAGRSHSWSEDPSVHLKSAWE